MSGGSLMYKTFRNRETRRQELDSSRREVLLFFFVSTVIIIHDLRAFQLCTCCCWRATTQPSSEPSLIIVMFTVLFGIPLSVSVCLAFPCCTRLLFPLL